MSVAADSSVYNKDNPFPAVLKENRLLNKEGSAKETRHFVVNIDGSGLSYSVGDSLGVFPSNPEESVTELLQVLGCTGDEQVQLPKDESPIAFRDALTSRLSLASPTRKFLDFLLSKVTDDKEKADLLALVAPEAKAEMMSFLAEREFVDLITEFPSAKPTPQEVVDHMRRLVPRLYSIASSPALYPQDVHLTIAVVRYQTNNRARVGVCSTFLADRVDLNTTPVPVFVASSHFGVPDDNEADVIMIGPGTGIAPFRAFLQERDARGAKGRNWLFFGDQHHKTDFLYEEEFQAYQSKGLLQRLDTAFSRDQAQKVYVQDRMRENAEELWKWIEKGAFFFVCGDAKRMAKDVDAALHDVIATQSGMGEVAAAEYVKAMKKEKRYQRDVY